MISEGKQWLTGGTYDCANFDAFQDLKKKRFSVFWLSGIKRLTENGKVERWGKWLTDIFFSETCNI